MRSLPIALSFSLKCPIASPSRHLEAAPKDSKTSSKIKTGITGRPEDWAAFSASWSLNLKSRRNQTIIGDFVIINSSQLHKSNNI